MHWLTKLRLQIRFSLLVVLVLGLIFAFMAWQGMQAMETATGMALDERLALAHSVALHLEKDLEWTLDRLAQVAAFPTIDLEDGDLEPEKAELQALYRPYLFNYVFLLDKEGLVLWTEPYLPEVVGTHRMECPHVQEALRTGQPDIACVAHALTPQSPTVAPVMPVRNKEGVVVGLLGAGIDPSSPTFADLLWRVIPARTSYAQLVDENGRVLAHTEGRGLFQRSEHADLFVSLLREKRAAVSTETVTEEGKGTFREVIAFVPLSVAPWGVAVEQAEAELLAPALELRRRMYLFAVTAVAGTLFLVWVTTRSVVEPVRKLVAASRRITAGDLATPVPPLGEDEIGELGRRFEDMRGKLAAWGEELEQRVAERTGELSTLYAIAATVSRSLDLDETLNITLDKVMDVIRPELAVIYLRHEQTEELTLEAHRGISLQFAQDVGRLPKGLGGPQWAVESGEPVIVENALEHPDPKGEALAREGVRAFVITPLESRDKVLGTMIVGYRTPRTFAPEFVALLTAIGHQIGVAVENARLYEELQRHSKQLEQRVMERTAALRTAQDELLVAQRLATIGQMAATVSHELRNPLTAIRNVTYYLNTRLGDADDRVQQNLDILQREVERASRIMTDLLDFSRVRSPSLQPTDLKPVLEEALARAAPPPQVTVKVEVQPDLPPVMTDADQMQQVFVNLITNAVQAMPEGGTLEVHATQREVEPGTWNVELAFTDTGEGIPEENMSRLFEPLFTTRAKGIGLGLAISQRLVEAHGGSIEVHSEVGVGSTFTVRLPVQTSEVSETSEVLTHNS